MLNGDFGGWALAVLSGMLTLTTFVSTIVLVLTGLGGDTGVRVVEAKCFQMITPDIMQTISQRYLGFIVVKCAVV